jgi:hypothetical protein
MVLNYTWPFEEGDLVDSVQQPWRVTTGHAHFPVLATLSVCMHATVIDRATLQMLSTSWAPVLLFLTNCSLASTVLEGLSHMMLHYVSISCLDTSSATAKKDALYASLTSNPFHSTHIMWLPQTERAFLAHSQLLATYKQAFHVGNYHVLSQWHARVGHGIEVLQVM